MVKANPESFPFPAGKAINGTGSMDCTYHNYYSGQSLVEERNGDNEPIKQMVWGPGYVDDLVQVAMNYDPGTNRLCDRLYWACQDANYNVLGITDSGDIAHSPLRHNTDFTRKIECRRPLACMIKHGAGMSEAHSFCYANATSRTGFWGAVRGYGTAIPVATVILGGEILSNINSTIGENPIAIKDP